MSITITLQQKMKYPSKIIMNSINHAIIDTIDYLFFYLPKLSITCGQRNILIKSNNKLFNVEVIFDGCLKGFRLLGKEYLTPASLLDAIALKTNTTL